MSIKRVGRISLLSPPPPPLSSFFRFFFFHHSNNNHRRSSFLLNERIYCLSRTANIECIHSFSSKIEVMLKVEFSMRETRLQCSKRSIRYRFSCILVFVYEAHTWPLYEPIYCSSLFFSFRKMFRLIFIASFFFRFRVRVSFLTLSRSMRWTISHLAKES